LHWDVPFVHLVSMNTTHAYYGILAGALVLGQIRRQNRGPAPVEAL
jgi:hypothetical protein